MDAVSDNAVLFDAWCGEPIAWARIGEPVIEHAWTEHGRQAVTEWLSAAEAIRRYGPISEVVLGRQGGFKSVTYGDKKFLSRCVDPRGTNLFDDSVVVIDDPVRDNHECPVCGAAPGHECVDTKDQPHSSHAKRKHGRSRWEIEQATAAEPKRQEEALAAAEWDQKMATPPAIGATLEIENRKLNEAYQWVSADPDRYVVLHTYSNRVVQARAEGGERVFLTRNEVNGTWFRVCGEPTSVRLPCKNHRCQSRHRAGLALREDQPW